MQKQHAQRGPFSWVGGARAVIGHGLACLLGAALVLGPYTVAQAQADAVPTEPTVAAVPRTDGEIKRIDADAGKLTIKHGPIRNLDMPAMTMVFVARDGAPLGSLKVGDKILFLATHEGGKYIASAIQATP